MELLPSVRLARALSDAADMVEADLPNANCWNHPYEPVYAWSAPEKCNCGLVTRALGIATEPELKTLVTSCWNEVSRYTRGLEIDSYLKYQFDKEREDVPEICTQSGLTVREVFRRLESEGVTVHDIACLENLADPAIRVRAGLHLDGVDQWSNTHSKTGLLSYFDRNEPRAFIAYARAWAAIITESHAALVTDVNQVSAETVPA